MTRKLAVLSNQAILLQGIILQLSQFPQSFDLQVLDIEQEPLMEKLVENRPDLVVLDADDLTRSTSLRLADLFRRLPDLILVEVNIHTSSVHIIRSQTINASSMEDFQALLVNTVKKPVLV